MMDNMKWIVLNRINAMRASYSEEKKSVDLHYLERYMYEINNFYYHPCRDINF